MKTAIYILLILFCAGMAFAQKTQTEVVREGSAIENTRPNDPRIPEVIALSGQFERVLVLRFKYDTDLLAGLKETVEREKVNNAVILSGIGSVRGYSYHIVSNREFPSRNYFIKDPAAPADLVSVNGYVINGRVHAHVAFSGEEGAFGGHLEPGTAVFTFAVLTLGILSDDVDLTRVDDKSYR